MIKECKNIMLLLSLCCTVAQAQTAREEIAQDITLAGDNYTAYRVPDVKLTEAPKGYKACYMSHYGRHGSRYLIGDKTYSAGYDALKEADENGQLTDLGRKLMGELDIIRRDASGHVEELTKLGAQQHRGIAHRMYENFPELFEGDKKIEARSSTVVRCILSMANEIAELQGLNPELEIDMDASEGDMHYIVYEDKELKKLRKPKGSPADSAYNAFAEQHYNPARLMNSLFASESYWREHIKNARRFVIDNIWKLAANMQSTELRRSLSLYEYFTEDELYNIWLTRNAEWYITHGPSPLNGGTQIYYQRNLIRKMIAQADSCLALIEQADRMQADAYTGATTQYSTGKSVKIEPLTANLRFGHEVVVMPTVCFLNLNGYGKQYNSLEDLEKNQWYDYRIFPMGSNIQMVFYRKNGSPTLVKVLLNEKEATMPDLTPVTGCYYKWEDIKAFCTDKLAKYGK